MKDNLKSVVCNSCGHGFFTRAEDKNIRCPRCKSNKSLSIVQPLRKWEEEMEAAGEDEQSYAVADNETAGYV